MQATHAVSIIRDARVGDRLRRCQISHSAITGDDRAVLPMNRGAESGGLDESEVDPIRWTAIALTTERLDWRVRNR